MSLQEYKININYENTGFLLVAIAYKRAEIFAFHPSTNGHIGIVSLQHLEIRKKGQKTILRIFLFNVTHSTWWRDQMQVCHTLSLLPCPPSSSPPLSIEWVMIEEHLVVQWKYSLIKAHFTGNHDPYPPPASLYVRRHYFQIDNTPLSLHRFTYLLRL